MWVAVAAAAVVVLVGVVGVVGTLLLRRVVTATGSVRTPPSGSAPAGTAGSAQDRRAAGISVALTAMTKAVREHDEAGFLAAFAPKNTALLTRQRAVFRGMTALPMDSATFSWPSGEYQAPSKPASYPAGAIVAAVDFRYALHGWDAEVVDDGIPLTLAPIGGRWLVVGDSEPIASLDSGRYAEPWSVGEVIVVKRAHVLVVGEKSHRTSTERLATRLEGLVADVRKVWPERSWNGKVVAYAITDKRFIKEWFGSQAADGKQDDPHGQASFVAKVTVLSKAGVGREWEAASPRLIMTPYLLSQVDDYSLSLLRHEVTHVATVMVGRADPAWIREGVAEYTGFKLGGTKVAAARTLARHGLPSATVRAMQRGTWRPKLVNEPDAFYDSDATTVEAAYVDAWLACLYVADKYGDATLRALYDRAASRPAAEAMNQVDADALQAVLHTDHTAFTAAVRAYGLKLIRQVR